MPLSRHIHYVSSINAYHKAQCAKLMRVMLRCMRHTSVFTMTKKDSILRTLTIGIIVTLNGNISILEDFKDIVGLSVFIRTQPQTINHTLRLIPYIGSVNAIMQLHRPNHSMKMLGMHWCTYILMDSVYGHKRKKQKTTETIKIKTSWTWVHCFMNIDANICIRNCCTSCTTNLPVLLASIFWKECGHKMTL